MCETDGAVQLTSDHGHLPAVQGLAKTEREVREREEREREAMLQRQRAMDAGNNGSVSISRAEAVPPQHIRCLTTWVNSVLPEHMAISEPCGERHAHVRRGLSPPVGPCTTNSAPWRDGLRRAADDAHDTDAARRTAGGASDTRHRARRRRDRQLEPTRRQPRSHTPLPEFCGRQQVLHRVSGLFSLHAAGYGSLPALPARQTFCNARVRTRFFPGALQRSTATPGAYALRR
jgi:hypothetical protein